MRTLQNQISLSAIILSLLLSGCASTGKTAPRGESQQEAVSAMKKVLGTVSGQDIDEKKLRELNTEMQKDPQARSAVETISNSVSGKGQTIKYCPVDGERYGPKFTDCPVHHVPLKILSE